MREVHRRQQKAEVSKRFDIESESITQQAIADVAVAEKTVFIADCQSTSP